MTRIARISSDQSRGNPPQPGNHTWPNAAGLPAQEQFVARGALGGAGNAAALRIGWFAFLMGEGHAHEEVEPGTQLLAQVFQLSPQGTLRMYYHHYRQSNTDWPLIRIVGRCGRVVRLSAKDHDDLTLNGEPTGSTCGSESQALRTVIGHREDRESFLT
jgi:hypothetical protein